MRHTFLYVRRKIFDLSMAKRKIIKEQLPCLSHKKIFVRKFLWEGVINIYYIFLDLGESVAQASFVSRRYFYESAF